MNASCPIQIVAAVEVRWTRDHIRELPDGSWSTHPTPPPGEGWQIAKFDKETRTQWQRPVLAIVEEG
jgi:hypothetical protein